MQTAAPRRLRRVALLVLFTSCAAGIGAMSTARKFPSPSAIKHVVVPEAELTTHSLGGGPDGGEVYSLAIAPTQPATVFAAFWAGGVFKSNDRGANWTPADRGLPQGRACDLVADAVNPAVLYAKCFPDLFKTTNGGATWQQLDVDDADAPIIAPSDSRILYERPGPASIVRSVDGGRHWTQNATSGLPDGAGPCAVDPRNAFLLYAASSDGLFTSRDGGVTWTRSGRGLLDHDIETIAIDPFNDGIAYVGTFGGALYKTTTGGAMWVRTGDGLNDGRISALTVGGLTSELLHARVDGRLFRSTDAGEHWQAIDDGLPQQISGGFVVDPSSPSILYVGTYAGVFVTTDGGARWTSVNRGVSRMRVDDIVVQDGKPSMLFVRGDAGTFSSGDMGVTWQRLDSAGAFADSDVERLDSDGSGGVVVQTRSKQRFERRREKSGWMASALDPPADLKLLWFSPSNRAAMYATTTDSLLRTADGGRHWHAVGLPDGRVPMTLAIAPRDSAVAYAGLPGIIQPKTVWRTVNGGAKWDEVDVCTALFTLAACQPLFDPNDVNRVFVVVRNVGIGGGGDLIMKTADGGVSWSEVDLPGLSEKFVVLPTTPTTVFAQVYNSADGGYLLLKSVDGGEHWTTSDAGLPAESAISDIIADPANPAHLFAGTRGRGVFQSRDGGRTWYTRP